MCFLIPHMIICYWKKTIHVHGHLEETCFYDYVVQLESFIFIH